MYDQESFRRALNGERETAKEIYGSVKEAGDKAELIALLYAMHGPVRVQGEWVELGDRASQIEHIKNTLIAEGFFEDVADYNRARWEARHRFLVIDWAAGSQPEWRRGTWGQMSEDMQNAYRSLYGAEAFSHLEEPVYIPPPLPAAPAPSSTSTRAKKRSWTAIDALVVTLLGAGSIYLLSAAVKRNMPS